MNLPILGTALAGWRDVFRGVQAMPGIFLLAFLIVAAFALIDQPSAEATEFSLQVELLSLAEGFARLVLLAPLFIVVHRYVLLGEVAAWYPLAPFSPLFRRFVGFGVLLHLILSIPILIIYGLGFSLFFKFALTIVVIVAIIIISLRTLMLFPAVAIDAPDAGWSAALRQSKGHVWHLLATIVVTGLPVVIVAVFHEMMKSESPLLAALLISAFEALSLSAFAAVASRFYRALTVQPEAAPSPA